MPLPGIFGWSPGSGGVHHYRIAEPLRVAGQLGTRVATGRELNDDIAAHYDTILVHMLHDEANSEAWEKLARNEQHRLVFDCDDAMWSPDWKPFKEHYRQGNLDRLFRNISMAHVVTTPSEHIGEYLARYNSNVWHVPNTVPESVLSLKMHDSVGPVPLQMELRIDIIRSLPPSINPIRLRFVVGYQGSSSHATDFAPRIFRELRSFLDDNNGWELHVWGKRQDEIDDPTGRTIGHPWEPNFARYYQSLRMNIGIGPLRRSEFNAGKSGLRAIEYAALGIPAVLTDWYPYRDYVEDGVTGFLVSPVQSWAERLTTLARDPELRRSMAEAARARAVHWTTEHNILRWMAAWESVQKR